MDKGQLTDLMVGRQTGNACTSLFSYAARQSLYGLAGCKQLAKCPTCARATRL
jgi:hypothetical protein